MKSIHRLYEYLEYKSIKPAQFEKGAGLSNGYLGTQLKREADLGEGVLNKIINYCLDLNPNWLLTGKGEMIKQPPPVMPLLKDEQGSESAAVPDNDGIPLIPIEAMAGFGTDNSATVMEYECEKYFVPDFKGAEFLIQVKGSSMYPKYSSGDIVACKKLPLDTFFQWNKVYVIDSEQGVLIKRIKRGEDKDHIVLVSENDRYEPFELHRKDIQSLAIVIGVIRLE